MVNKQSRLFQLSDHSEVKMRKTRLLNTLDDLLHYITFYSLGYTAINLIALLFGFFCSTVVSTIISQTGDLAVISAAILVTYLELFGKYVYQTKLSLLYERLYNKVVILLNSIRVGILYGLFVDAFKLGS